VCVCVCVAVHMSYIGNAGSGTRKECYCMLRRKCEGKDRGKLTTFRSLVFQRRRI